MKRNYIFNMLLALMLCMGAFFTPMRAFAEGNGTDSTPPSVRVELSEGMLHIEAEDADSGVDAVYIGGRRVNYREGNPAEFDITEFAGTEDKTVVVYAVDFAGNQSEAAEVFNPYYEAEKEKKPITPDGQATVADAVTDKDGKEFYTFVTPEENVFYLVIDKERDTDNVYFLNAVTEADLMDLAEKQGEDAAGSGNTAGSEKGSAEGSLPEGGLPELAACTCHEKCEAGMVDVSCAVCKNDLSSCMGKEKEPAETEEAGTKESKNGNSGTFIFILTAALAVGGAGYYLKIYKPKHALDDAEDLEDLLDDGDEAEVNEDDAADGEESAGEKNMSGIKGYGAEEMPDTAGNNAETERMPDTAESGMEAEKTGDTAEGNAEEKNAAAEYECKYEAEETEEEDLSVFDDYPEDEEEEEGED